MAEEDYEAKFPVGCEVVVIKSAAVAYGVRPNAVGKVKSFNDGKFKVKFKKKKSIEINGHELQRVDELENQEPEECENCASLQEEKKNLMEKINALKAQLVCTNCDAKEAEDQKLLAQIEEIKLAQKEAIQNCNVHPKLQEETEQLKDQVQTLEVQLKEREDYRKTLQTEIKEISSENDTLKNQIENAKKARDLKLQQMRVQFRQNAKNFKQQKKDLMLEAQKLENQKDQLEVELRQMNRELNDKKNLVKQTVENLMAEMAKYPEDNSNRPLSQEAQLLREKIREIRDRAKNLDIVQIDTEFN